MNNSTKNQILCQVLETNDRQRKLVIMKALKAFKRNVNERGAKQYFLRGLP